MRGNADRCVVTAFDGAIPRPSATSRCGSPTPGRPRASRLRSATGWPRCRRWPSSTSTASGACCSATARRTATRSGSAPSRRSRGWRGSSTASTPTWSSAATRTASSTRAPAAAGWSNAGSVGRPCEREPGAYWLRIGPGVELRRTVYDTAAATEAFRALGYPDADGMAADADPDEVAARFEAAADAPLPPESLTGRRAG